MGKTDDRWSIRNRWSSDDNRICGSREELVKDESENDTIASHFLVVTSETIDSDSSHEIRNESCLIYRTINSLRSRNVNRLDSNNYKRWQTTSLQQDKRAMNHKDELFMISRSTMDFDQDEYSKLNHHYDKTKPKPSFSEQLKKFVLLTLLIFILCLIICKAYYVLHDDYNHLGVVETPSLLGQFKHYAVSTDAKPCARVGRLLLDKGGSAVDAAIATAICMGVAIPNSLGLGGGCLMTIYDRKSKRAIVIDGRETAPNYAYETMFVNDSKSASRGPLSVGIPGELAAYWRAHQMFGKLNWSELFDESIIFAEHGLPMAEHLSYALNKTYDQISDQMKRHFFNNDTGRKLIQGEIHVQKNLAETLRRIRDNGAKEFYEGEIGKLFIADLQAQGGKMIIKDLVDYQAIVREPLVFDLHHDLRFYAPPPPGSGIVLSVILRIMKKLGYYQNIRPQDSAEESDLFFHRLTEAYKFAYGQRAGLEDNADDPERMKDLIDKLSSQEFIDQLASKIDDFSHERSYYDSMDYFSEDHGTAHLSVLDGEGNAAAITSSVNLYFGSGLISESTGIIYNDVMDDFVSPNLVNKFGLAPSRFNRIRPGRRPLSSMTPSIFTDHNGDVRLIIGGSGGSKITTAIAYVAIRNCFLGESIKTAIDASRIHHQLLPNHITYESNFQETILHSLEKRGHLTEKLSGRSSVIMAIASSPDASNHSLGPIITANSDYRKGGTVDGF